MTADQGHHASLAYEHHVVRAGEADEANDTEEATYFVKTASSSIAFANHLEELGDLSAGVDYAIGSDIEIPFS